MASAGTLESNDCYITVSEHQGIKIVLESIVMEQFGKQIRKVIEETLNSLGVKNLMVHCNDKGALDYAIRARLVTAIERLGDQNA
jgi:citrate lyase subunit gamma (acyl carrier protein)